ncbi:Thioredoxin reductase (plasmid) [Rhodococcus sp. WAY2]|nr:Thioredoxin reductase [Rhodococcus sp. WAY2]
MIRHGEKVLRNPTNAELARIVGLPVPDSVRTQTRTRRP